MMLIPTSCWKAASPTPTKTTGANRRVSPYEQVRQARPVLAAGKLCSTCRTNVSASPADPSEDFTGVVPFAVGDQKAGRLGDDRARRTRNAIDGTASIQNIQRQAGAPSQRVAPAPPATLARMSLLRKALNNPSTMAICWSEASRPRMCDGATSEIYIRGEHAGGTDGQTAHEARGDEEHSRIRHCRWRRRCKGTARR